MCRSALAILALFALPVASVSAQTLAYDRPDPTTVRHYGEAPLQVGELRVPEGAGPFPVAVTIHGGCWQAGVGEGSTSPAAAALAEAGIATWDIEYRRVGHEGGGWPGTFLDVGAGVDYLRVLASEYPLDLTAVVLVGHSSGAALAVWAAGRPGLPPESEIRGVSPLPVRAAVGIDGPMDLAAWSDAGNDVRGCGAPVIWSVMGGSKQTQPVRYQQASPAEMPRIEAAIFLNPSQVMLGQGRPDAMTTRARNTGEAVTVRPVPNSDHYQLINPSHEAWSAVLETIQAAFGLPDAQQNRETSPIAQVRVGIAMSPSLARGPA